MDRKEMYKRWNNEARSVLVGRTIAKVQYMDDAWADQLGFTDYMARPVMIQLDDGTLLIPLRDDEGNGGGAIEYLRAKEGQESGVLPTL